MKRIKPILLPVIISALMLVQMSCKRGPTEPEFKNPREFTWKADTINSDQLAMQLMAVWGLSSSDVYTVGYPTAGPSYKMLHYDGKGWAPVALPPFAGDLWDVFGFGPGDIYAVGSRVFESPNPPPSLIDSAIIFHFDGSVWIHPTVPEGSGLVTIWGSSPKDIWTAGRSGTIFHFDGQAWSKIPMDRRLGFGDITGFAANDVYMLAGRYNDPDPAYNYSILFHYDGKSWQAVDSANMAEYDPHFGPYRIGTVGSTLYSLGDRIFAYRNGQWQSESGFTYGALQGIYAVSATNAIVVGQNSQIFHYDGNTWLQLTGITGPDWWLRGVWSTDRETFIVGPGRRGSIILHGK
jgi:hypothetical protein